MVADQVAAFVEVLRRFQLLDPAELAALAPLLPRFKEPREVAQHLVQHGRLTAFQLPFLAKGRAADLVLGDYVLLDLVGEGGMGQVYKARQRKFARTVALKVIKPERLQTADAVKRFQREIQAAAKLNHPNIVRAYDADQDRATGVHLFAMEFVEGVELHALVAQRGPLPIPLACECVRQAALGLQHAQEQGLVHRDVKPSNLVLTPPPEPRAPLLGPVTIKILDFGLARLERGTGAASATSLTHTGVVMGTPDYMAPEQTRDSKAVDVRTDLYALGCTFYFLLSGRPPFPDGDMMAKLFKQCFEEPVPLGQLRDGVPPRVNAIVRKLMAKRPEDRFQTPAELAEALAQPLDGPLDETLELPSLPPLPAPPPAASPFADLTEPASRPVILPRPPRSSPAPAVLALGMGLGLVGLLGLALLAFNAPAGPRPTDDAEASRAATKPAAVGVAVAADQPWQDLHLDLEAGAAVTFQVQGHWKLAGEQPLWPEADPGGVVLRLAGDKMPLAARAGQPFVPQQGGRLFAQANRRDLKGCAGVVTVTVDGGKPNPAPVAAPARTWQELALDDWEKEIAPLRGKPGPERVRRECLTFLRRHSGTTPAAWALDLLAQTLPRLPSPLDGLDPARLPPAEVRPGQPAGLVAILGAHRQRHWGAVTALALTGDGKFLVSGGTDGAVRAWDAVTMDEGPAFHGHAGAITALALSPASSAVISGDRDGLALLWELGKGTAGARPLHRGGGPVQAAVFLDGTRAATAVGRTISLWDRGGEDGTLEPSGPVLALAAAANPPRLLALHGDPPAVTVYDLAERTAIRKLPLPGPAQRLAVSPDGKLAAASGGPGPGYVLDLDGAAEPVPLPAPCRAAAFLPDQPRVLCAAGTALALRDPRSGQAQTVAAPGFEVTAAAADTRAYFSGGQDGAVRRWALGGREQPALGGALGPALSLAWHPDGRPPVLAIAYAAGAAVAEVGPGAEPRRLPLRLAPATAVAFAADGKALAIGGEKALAVWPLGGPQREPAPTAFEGHGNTVTAVALTPDGRKLLSASLDHTARLWDAETGAELRRFEGHTAGVLAVALAPDGRRAATAGDQMVRVWDTDAAQELGRFAIQGGARHLTFTPDGRRLLIGGQDGTVRWCDPATGQELWRVEAAKRQPVQRVAVAPDGRLAAATGPDHQVRLWRLEGDTARPLPPLTFPGPVRSLAFAPDGRHLATANANGTVYVLRLAAPGK